MKGKQHSIKIGAHCVRLRGKKAITKDKEIHTS